MLLTLCARAYNHRNNKPINMMMIEQPVLTAIAVLLAVAIDRLLGEPKRFHPLVGFGNLAHTVEQWLNQQGSRGRLRGAMALFILLALCVPVIWLVIYAVQGWVLINTVLTAVILYFCIALRSLQEHALAIAAPLEDDDIIEARLQLAKIVSRDTAGLNEQQIATACCESVLENGSDGIFAAIFWFVVGGVPAVLCYRMVNTLDAMWGYRNSRFYYFGWAAARADDVMNWLPARLVAFSYALCGNLQTALLCWRRQANTWYSPNAGPVMAAGAGSLGITLGGEALYDQQTKQRPILGQGQPASAADIHRALALLNRSMLLWLATLFASAIFFMMM